MNKTIGIMILVFFALLFHYSWAQDSDNKDDVFLSFDYEKLIAEFNINLEDKKKLAHKYARAYYSKAKKLNDTTNQALGYNLLSLSAKDYETSVLYLDSLIDFTKNYEADIFPAASAYYMKSELQYHNNDYKEALDNALIANDLLKKEKDYLLKYVVKSSIAIQRARIGEHEEALEYYHKSLDYFRSKNSEYFEMTLFGLSESHMALKQFDSTKIYADRGLKFSTKTESKNYAYFVYTFGELAYHRGQYKKAVDSLVKSRMLLRELNDLPNLALNEYWLGVTREKLGEESKAIHHYKVVDSIFNVQNTIPLTLRNTWVKLIKYYQNNNDIESELLYSQKLLKVDSIINADYKYLSQNITSKFVVPNLIEKNEENLMNFARYKKGGTLIVIGLLSLILLAIILFYFYRKNELQKSKNYELVIERLKNPEKENSRANGRKLELSPDLMTKIESGLDLFEKNEEYLASSITVGEIAKKIGTNQKYLSQFINYEKNMKFPDYINSLRIDYALRRFETNEGKFRAWKLNAVAKELGFNSREYYVKAFVKYTGMKPNHYLDRLIKDIEKHRDS